MKCRSKSPYVEYYETPLQRFLRTPPKGNFKALFIGTPIGRRLEEMSKSKSVPDGLRDQECERGSRTKRPPISYVPAVDPVQDAVSGTKKYPLKIKLPDNTEFSVPIWNTGTPEAFLIHVQQALGACRRKGFFEDHETAKFAESEHNDAAVTFREAIAKAKEPKGKKGSKKDPILQKGEESPDDVPAQVSEPSDLAESLKGALARRRSARQKKAKAAEEFFSLYANLLGEDARFQWDKIVTEQTGTAPWTDLQGKEHERAREKDHDSFQDCVTFHLLTVFPNDAAEQQRYYISNMLKKPQRVQVRYFFQRVEQLNSYLSHLPCLHDSPRANPATKPVQGFDEAELANLTLRMCPDSWMDLYDLTQDSIPQSMRKLLAVLENIEKCNTNSATQAAPSNEKAQKSNGNFEKSGKRKGSRSSTDRIPKKPRVEKHCVLCQKHGTSLTAPSTHNTNECRRYEKDGTVKNSSGKFSVQNKSYKKPEGNSFAQLTERFSKLEKAIKKGNKKSSHRKKKSRHDSDSSSDSE